MNILNYIRSGIQTSIVVLATLLCVVGGIGTMSVSASQSSIDTSRHYEEVTEKGEDTVKIGEIFQRDATDKQGASEKIQKAYNIDFEDEQRGTAYVVSIINWFLAITGLIALIILIFGFYRILVSGDNEESLKKARKTVVSAVFALLVIGTAWFIVSQLFDIFFRVKGDTSPG